MCRGGSACREGGEGGDNTKHNGVLRECVVYGLTSECACPIDSHKRTYI